MPADEHIADWVEQAEARWRAFEAWLEAFHRGPFSAFCLGRCRGRCCDLRRTELYLTRAELAALLGLSEEDPGLEAHATQAPGAYRWAGGWCPRFDPADRRCALHGSALRPAICGLYPFGAEAGPRCESPELRLSPLCPLEGEPLLEELRQGCRAHGVRLIQVRP